MVYCSNSFSNNKVGEKKMNKKGSQIQWTISLVMIGLFVIAILGFAINFAADNNSPIDLADDPELSGLSTSTQGNVEGFNTDAEETYNSIANSSISPTSSSGTTATAGQFAITPVNVIGTVNNILKVGWSKIFGSNSGFEIFITTFIGMIVFITALYIWKTWAGRSPD